MNLNRLFYLVILFSGIFICSCTQSPTNQEQTSVDINKNNFNGHWIRSTYLSQLKHSQSVSGIEDGLEELYIKAGVDSVFFTNGFEEVSLPYIKLNDSTLQIPKFNQDSITQLVLSTTGKKLSYYYQSTGQQIFFDKIDSLSDSHNEVFLYNSIVNQLILEGHYLLKNSTSSDHFSEVLFQKDGTVTGWQDVQKFELCIAGDCRNFFDQDDLISLTTPQKTEDFILVQNKNTLALYQVVNVSKPDEMPFYKRGKLMYELHKKIT